MAIPKSVHAERIQQNFNVNNFVLSPADMVQIGSDITSVPDSPPGGRKSTVVSALRILGGHDSGGVFFSLHGQMIFSHPVIELDKICHKLGSRHELTEPRSAKLLGSGEECLGFFWIDQRVDRRVRIAYDPAQVIREKLLVARVVSLRVRAFFCGAAVLPEADPRRRRAAAFFPRRSDTSCSTAR